MHVRTKPNIHHNFRTTGKKILLKMPLNNADLVSSLVREGEEGYSTAKLQQGGMAVRMSVPCANHWRIR
jgi:hypothetical protein